MRGFKYLILFLVIGAGIYFYFHKEENFKVKDNIIVTQASGMDISGPITAPPKYASIKGTITNISKKNFTDIEILYQTGLDTIKAVIGYLPSGGSSEFETGRIMVRSGHPDYEIVDIPCKEE
jgi:hypothetical protein